MTPFQTLASGLSKLLDDQTLAAVIDQTLIAQADPQLTDREALLVYRLFDELTDLRPDLVEVAQGRDHNDN